VQDALGDARMALAGRPPTGDVIVVDIDEQSLAAVGRWPWPRSIHAAIVDALRVDGAAGIALDIDFSAASSPAEDRALADALARADGAVVLAAFRQRTTGAAGGAITYTAPLPQFADHAWVATVDVRPDADGVIRRLSYADTVGGKVVPSMAATLAGGSGSTARDFVLDFGIHAGAIVHISATDLLAGRIAPERIAGKLAIVGSAAVELHDFFRVPVHGVISGAMVQALAVETLLQHRALGHTGAPVTMAGLAALAILFFLALGRARWFVVLGGTALAALAIEFAAGLLQAALPVAVDTAPWQAAIAGFALLVLIREIDFRRILLLISRTQAHNTQTILDRIVDDNFAGVLVVDEGGVVRAASRAAEDILGVRALVGRSAASVLPARLMEAVCEAIAARRGGVVPPSAVRELVLYPNRQERRILEYVVTPSRLSGGISVEGRSVADGFIACLTFSDVSARHLAAERMEKLARFDTLTGLPNRNEFMERLAQVLARGHEVAVLCLDLDRFKAINDTFGHSVGDLLLTAVGKRLGEVAAAGTVARTGGDAYAILLSGEGVRGRAEEAAGKLIARIGEPFGLGPHRLIASLSIGIAVAAGGADPQVVFKQADSAHHRAKEAGGNRWIAFSDEMLAGVESSQSMELALWEGLERGEFEVFYQPQVDLGSGRIVGVEALLRWHHPQRGAVPPSEFIAVAEAAGLIQPLGEWVLRTACAEVARWPGALRLAVNVSAVQFTRGDLVATVASALARSGFPAERLDLEITESLLVTQDEGTARQMHALAAMGVRFALDDFGTGYSSLGYLTKFAIGKIKLDRSFVAGVPHDPAMVAVVQAVGLLANTLSIPLIAEGIENADHVPLLRLLGCKEGQGYLFGRPAPAATFLAALEPERMVLAG
jgi:diguanylate cyclase (GGDEF)-like protein